MIAIGLAGGSGAVLAAGPVSPTPPAAVIGALIGALVLGIAAFLLAGRLAPRFVGAIALLGALSAGFGLYVSLSPTDNDLVALVLFAAIFGFFRLLSRFESINAG